MALIDLETGDYENIIVCTEDELKIFLLNSPEIVAVDPDRSEEERKLREKHE